MKFLTLFQVVSALISIDAFMISNPTNRVHRLFHAPHRTTNLHQLYAVTEEDVIELVEKAEKLWAEALEARKEANALTDKADEAAEAAAESAKEANDKLQEGAISLEKIAAADQAQNANLDANSFLSRALGAAEEADKLEAAAETALAESEAALEQHLVDFPNSNLC